jgi:hypothetical protein
MSVEERIRAATRAAADTVEDIRELELPAAPARRGARRMPPSRRWWTWAAPLAAAAAVIALAASLVVVKGSSNARPAPARPAPAADAVPRYYVELDPQVYGKIVRDGLLVGDTLTGKTVATVPPPTGASFDWISAAGDDRTFAVSTEPAGARPASAQANAENCFLLRLAPGTASPVQISPIPIKPLYGLAGCALSASGNELAIALSTGKTQVPWLGVYSIATGRLLHSWSVRGTPPFHFSSLYAGLGWTDGDQSVVFTTGTLTSQTVRRVDLAAAGGDLVTDSYVIWPTPDPPRGHPGSSCELGTYLAVSADGKTLVCQVSTSNVTTKKIRWTVRWMAYSLAARTAPHVLCQVSVTVPRTEDAMSAITLWVSPSGTTLLVDWAPYVSFGLAPATIPFGVVSHGTFTRLKAPPGNYGLLSGPPEIAW